MNVTNCSLEYYVNGLTGNVNVKNKKYPLLGGQI